MHKESDPQTIQEPLERGPRATAWIRSVPGRTLRFIQNRLLDILSLLLFGFGLSYLLVPILYGFVEVISGRGFNPLFDFFLFMQWWFVMLLRPSGADIAFIISIILWGLIYLASRRYKSRKSQKFVLFPLLITILLWVVLVPIDTTFLGRWRGANQLAGSYLLASAGGASQVRADALAYLNGASEKDFVEIPCLYYVIQRNYQVQEDHILIHLGAFFNMGVQFGFIIYDEEPTNLDPYYEPIWEYAEGVAMYGY